MSFTQKCARKKRLDLYKNDASKNEIKLLWYVSAAPRDSNIVVKNVIEKTDGVCYTFENDSVEVKLYCSTISGGR